MNFMELLPVVMNVKECYTVCFSEMFAQRKQTIRVLLRSFFQGWNKLNMSIPGIDKKPRRFDDIDFVMSYHVSKYFSCVSNVSIICKPVRVFFSK